MLKEFVLAALLTIFTVPSDMKVLSTTIGSCPSGHAMARVALNLKTSTSEDPDVVVYLNERMEKVVTAHYVNGDLIKITFHTRGDITLTFDEAVARYGPTPCSEVALSMAMSEA